MKSRLPFAAISDERVNDRPNQRDDDRIRRRGSGPDDDFLHTTSMIARLERVAAKWSRAPGNCEIGRILHLKSEIRKCKLDGSNSKFRISDLRCRIRPISKYSPPLASSVAPL